MGKTPARLWSIGWLGIFAVLGAACGGTSAPTAPTAQIKPPARISSAGQLVGCIDLTYAPAEFLKPDGTTPTGFDVDIFNELAKRMGVKPVVVNTSFNGLIAALQASKCDLVISYIGDSPERRQVVDFVDYVSSGRIFLVAPGNPKNIRTLEDLCGLAVGQEQGEIPLIQTEQAQSDKCKAAGKPPIRIVTFTSGSDVLQAVILGRVDAQIAPAMVSAYELTLPQYKGKFAPAGTPFDTQQEGILTRKDDTGLHDAVAKAMCAMQRDGTQLRLFATYGVDKLVTITSTC